MHSEIYPALDEKGIGAILKKSEVWTHYDATEITFENKDEKGLAQGRSITYANYQSRAFFLRADGQKKDGKKEGTWIFHLTDDPAIDVTTEENYVNDMREGDSVQTRLNKKGEPEIVARGRYENNMREGIWEVLEEEGDVRYIVTSYFVQGKRNGPYKKEHLDAEGNRTLAQSGMLEDDMMTGEWTNAEDENCIFYYRNNELIGYDEKDVVANGIHVVSHFTGNSGLVSMEVQTDNVVDFAATAAANNRLKKIQYWDDVKKTIGMDTRNNYARAQAQKKKALGL